ncbi:MAG: RNA-binding protein [Zhaonellaceae bacterium]|nr:RNA-binding protein [Clostridia bacterium]
MGDELRLGQLVYSKAGRDKGKVFLVISIASSSLVYVADGEMRKLEKPKKKNVRHLHNTGIIAEPIAHKLKRGEPFTNQEIRLAIARLVSEEVDTARQGG